MNSHAARRFSEATTLTMSPQQLVVMCFERIDRDLAGAVGALVEGDLSTANDLCCHAQEIVAELLSAVNEEAWEYSGQLVELYTWGLRELVGANVAKDASRVEVVRINMNELGSAFRLALNGGMNQLKDEI